MDIDAEKIAALKEGEVLIYEPGLPGWWRKPRAHDFHDFADRCLRELRIVFIAVDTPPTFTGDADLSRVFA
jgi:UDPglucose 6-dehydrogenase